MGFLLKEFVAHVYQYNTDTRVSKIPSASMAFYDRALKS